MSKVSQVFVSSLCYLLVMTVQAQPSTPLWTFTPLTPTSFPILSGESKTVQYKITNKSKKTHTLKMLSIAGISQQSSGSGTCAAAFTLAHEQSCTLSLSVNGSALKSSINEGPVVCDHGNPLQCYQPSRANSLAIVKDARVVLSSISVLALSVSDTATNPALIGRPRQFTINNKGSSPTINLAVSPTGLPTGTTWSTTCTAVLEGNSSCLVTVTPGATPSSNCASGTQPTPAKFIVSAGNAPTITIDVFVLSHGCQYQGGILFAVDDNTNTVDNSIGGSVVSVIDQVDVAVDWSVNAAGQPVYDLVPGINDDSTSPCQGNADGACNSQEILNFYPSSPQSKYAAGVCKQYNNGFSDWYLPAICELDAVNVVPDFTCSSGTQSIYALSFLTSACNPPSGTACLNGFYWSSTQSSAATDGSFAWGETVQYSPDGPASVEKIVGPASVRCARHLLTH